ncbi:MAG: flagellar motor protein MotB [Devosia sp.]
MAAADDSIIIKKVKKGGHAHHGGAWKIAYADFVTAMMAFFLMLWLISMTTDEQKKGLADYFAPASVSDSNSGAGGVMGGIALNSEGAMTSDAVRAEAPGVAKQSQVTKFTMIELATGMKSEAPEATADGKPSRSDLRSDFEQEFHSAAASIKQAWQAMPDIAEIADNLLVQETEEGLNIQIIDQTGKRMFEEGSKFPLEVTRKAIAALGPILEKLPNQITISGHTAAGSTYRDPHYGSWELSSDRANVVRAILGEFGLSEDHVSTVSGKSTSEPFFPDDPYLAPNERVEITVLHANPPVPLDLAP